jgi:hypothetical protein
VRPSASDARPAARTVSVLTCIEVCEHLIFEAWHQITVTVNGSVAIHEDVGCFFVSIVGVFLISRVTGRLLRDLLLDGSQVVVNASINFCC